MVQKNGLFIFRRDLRIDDNMALYHATHECDNVYTCFIFTPEQVSQINPYKSDNSIQFMIESLEDLAADIRSAGGELSTFYGKNKKVIRELIEVLNIDVVYFNRDYTPYAILRDDEISKMCNKMEVKCAMYQDYYLYEPGTITSKSGTIYKKFTPFYDTVLHMPVETSVSTKKTALRSYNTEMINSHIKLIDAQRIFVKKNDNVLVHGGRTEGRKRLAHVKELNKTYAETRNIFATNTSLLSAYIKFGCVSVREVYAKFTGELRRQLIWREFYAHVLFGYPELDPKNTFKWKNSAHQFDLWCKGKTGFPLVDAAMRQMNTTGWMHNRGRLVVSSFLVKGLLIDWKWGERYFAKKLIDYDVANNNGNWQWISGTGVDHMPYFRVFSPWTQIDKFDEDTEYIKRWIPELADVSPRDISQWNATYSEYPKIKYPKPIVDFNIQYHEYLKRY
jgi:deoxyribodipyrimidine photo-lyase